MYVSITEAAAEGNRQVNAEDHNQTIRKSFAIQAENFETPKLNFSKQEYLRYTIRESGFRPQDRVLETAAGTCALGRAIAPLVREITCLDITSEMLSIGKQEAEKSGIRNIRFVAGDSERMPFPDESFDAVITRLSFHHLQRPAAVFAEMKRVLKKSGSLILIDMEAAAPELRDREDELERMRDSSHVRNLSREEMRRLFRTEGITIRKCEIIKIPVSLKDWMDLTRTPAGSADLIEKRMTEEIAGGERTGFDPYMEEGRIFFQQRWIQIIGVKN